LKFARERRQPQGGKIDFLMHIEEADTYYEVEVMLGALARPIRESAVFGRIDAAAHLL
jgi:hypothetical protein